MSDLCLHCTCLIIKFFINNLKQKVCCLYLFFLLRSKHHFKYFCFILYELYNYGTISVTNARRFFFTNDCIERAFCFGEYEYFKMVIDMDFI